MSSLCYTTRVLAMPYYTMLYYMALYGTILSGSILYGSIWLYSIRYSSIMVLLRLDSAVAGTLLGLFSPCYTVWLSIVPATALYCVFLEPLYPSLSLLAAKCPIYNHHLAANTGPFRALLTRKVYSG